MLLNIWVNDSLYLKQKLPLYTIIQFCFKYYIDNIPRFCYHEKLSISGNCRMCLIEDSKSVKLIASCAINIISDIRLYTNTIKVKKAREGVLEFLSINHPLDCPICDQGGECDLQDITKIYGSDKGRFYEYKRSVLDKNFGPLIKTSMNRCIHCTRCIRYITEICGVYDLNMLGRGGTMEIGTYINKYLVSEISGNVIDLCPVGALTSKPYAFQARPWELKTYYFVDISDIFLTGIRVDIRGTTILRILPKVNSRIGEEWISDKIRFFYDSLKKQRLVSPFIMDYKFNLKYLKVSWIFILFYIKKSFYNELLFSIKNKYLFFKWFFLYNSFVDVYTLITCKLFLNRGGFYSYNKSLKQQGDLLRYSLNDFSFLKKNFIITNELILLIGINLRIDYPLFNIKLRNLVIKFNSLVYLLNGYCSYNYYVYNLNNSVQTIFLILFGKHWLCPFILKKSSVLFFSENYKRIFLSLIGAFKKLNFFFLVDNIKSLVLYEIGIINTSDLIFLYPCNFLIYSLGFDYGYSNKLIFYYKTFNIYQGHCGDLFVYFSKIILPSSFIFEKNTFFLNIFGEQKKNYKILPTYFKDIKSDWKILRAIFYSLFYNHIFSNSLVSVDNYLYKESPIFLNNSIHIHDWNYLIFSYRKNCISSFKIIRDINFFNDLYIYSFVENILKNSYATIHSMNILKKNFISWFL